MTASTVQSAANLDSAVMKDSRSALITSACVQSAFAILWQMVPKGRESLLDELLAAVDVVRCSGDYRVYHEVDGQRGNVCGTDHTPDRQGCAELLTARVELI